MNRPWMPFYVADYLADTMHLTAEQHGAYLLLIMHYWRKGGLPANADANAMQMQAICKLDADAYEGAKPLLRAFFDVVDGDWKHKRIDAELAKSTEISGKRRLAAKKRHGANAGANAMQMQTQPQSQSHKVVSNETTNARTREPSPVEREFAEFWESWPHKVGKPAALAKFKAARQSADFETIMAGVRRYVRDKPQDRPWLNPATFLNQQRWNDRPAETGPPVQRAWRGQETAAEIGRRMLLELKNEQTGGNSGNHSNLVRLPIGGTG